MIELPEKLARFLSKGAPALLLTVGRDGFPNTAYTWVLVPDTKRIRFTVDQGKGTLANLEINDASALQIVGTGDILFLVKGHSQMIKERIEAAPFPIAMMEMFPVEIKDQSWGDVVVEPLSYKWPDAQREKKLAMENAIYTEMSSAEVMEK